MKVKVKIICNEYVIGLVHVYVYSTLKILWIRKNRLKNLLQVRRLLILILYFNFLLLETKTLRPLKLTKPRKPIFKFLRLENTLGLLQHQFLQALWL